MGTNHYVEVNLEIVKRAAFRIELTEEEYRMLQDGDTSPLEARGLYEECDSFEPQATDYTVYDLDMKKQIVDWR